ncbi:GNAT family N-acetyltransferase [Curtobacterium sp. ISL-83]|uniref:GNAT family N-acetyltransferase n=1 Tax=Curtobacterium sp. ISL-83 TaxID=2819145 RepID=UPI001BE8AD38|nr:GNAT family protein [Curtobacterium sp. ISL-83]MBT2503186.1 GNAT family N-acetyltransferase [Curtobacterium sp. ISL-83]
MSVVLRPWRSSDAPALVGAADGDDLLVRQFGGTRFADVAAAEAFVREAYRFDDAVQHAAIVVDGRAVGDVALSAIEHRHGTAWVSYWLAREARGRGLAARGLVAVAARAFDRGLFRLELGHRTDNPASCRVARSAGFAVEGLERQKLRYGDRRYDVETHARLATDAAPTLSRLSWQD